MKIVSGFAMPSLFEEGNEHGGGIGIGRTQTHHSMIPVVVVPLEDWERVSSAITYPLTITEIEPETEIPHHCGYGGCGDSWVISGNYGRPVCRNPNHHKDKSE